MSEKERKNAAKERDRLERAVQTVIKASRDDADFTQQELGDRIGLTRDQIANIEGGRRQLVVSEFIMIAKALKLDPKVLLERVLLW